MEFLTTALVAVTVILIVYAFFKHFFFGPSAEEVFKQRNVPYVPLGNAFWDAINKVQPHNKHREAIKNHGPITGYFYLGLPTLLVSKPELIEQILSKNFTNFTNRRSAPSPDPSMKDALFVAKNETWKRIRATLTPTFALGKLRLMMSVLDQTAQTLLDNVNDSVARKEDVIDLKNFVGAYTMDSVIQIAFGIKIDSLHDSNHPVLENAKTFFQRDFPISGIVKGTIMFLLPPVAELFNIRLFGPQMDFFNKLADEIIEKKRASLKENAVQKPTSFIELVLEAEAERIKLEENVNQQSGKIVKYLTNGEIVAQSLMFFFAGYDTTATVITLFLYELSLHPDIQERLFEEIQETMDGNENPYEVFTYDTINKMAYLDAVTKEVMRVHTPATMTERRAQEDMTLESGEHKIHIKKDDIIQIPIYSVHRDPTNWPEPNTFNPDRFMGSPTYHKYSYLPFGAGPRDCIARSLAYLEVKVAVLHLIRCFRVEKCTKTPIPVEYFYQLLGMGLINKEVHVRFVSRSN